MVRHPDRVGKAIVALTLLTDHTYRTSVNGGNTLKVSLGPGSVKEFRAEEDFMIWVLSQIKTAVERELEWFQKKYPTAHKSGVVTKGIL